MMKKLILVMVLVLAILAIQAGNATLHSDQRPENVERPQFGERPKLVVGIVVDQMRWDYLSRYYDKFCEDGFRRMLDKGYSFDNCLIDYVPTVTAIGHTSA